MTVHGIRAFNYEVPNYKIDVENSMIEKPSPSFFNLRLIGIISILGISKINHKSKRNTEQNNHRQSREKDMSQNQNFG